MVNIRKLEAKLFSDNFTPVVQLYNILKGLETKLDILLMYEICGTKLDQKWCQRLNPWCFQCCSKTFALFGQSSFQHLSRDLCELNRFLWLSLPARESYDLKVIIYRTSIVIMVGQRAFLRCVEKALTIIHYSTSTALLMQIFWLFKTHHPMCITKMGDFWSKNVLQHFQIQIWSKAVSHVCVAHLLFRISAQIWNGLIYVRK